mmetsp:Transcript_3532/g.4512  ORF Transcript_3532/g.4512 Transcript_3532/m.4512 type:complete len:121 (+) Transcript_3532:95-457(+)
MESEESQEESLPDDNHPVVIPPLPLPLPTKETQTPPETHATQIVPTPMRIDKSPQDEDLEDFEIPPRPQCPSDTPKRRCMTPPQPPFMHSPPYLTYRYYPYIHGPPPFLGTYSPIPPTGR